MKIATILSTKGGPGKTMVTANLGAFCADANAACQSGGARCSDADAMMMARSVFAWGWRKPVTT